MEAVSFRPFNAGDIEFAYESTRIERWNYAKEDVERMFSYNPSGCFIADCKGEKVGHVFSVNYGKLGWIGLLTVRAEWRGEGIGTLLMRKVMDHLLGCGVETIKLEVVPTRLDARHIYQKLGFVDEYDSLRFLRTDEKIASVASSNAKLLRRNCQT